MVTFLVLSVVCIIASIVVIVIARNEINEGNTSMADSNLIGDECYYKTEAYLNGKGEIVLRKYSQPGKDMIINLNSDETQAIFELMISIKFYSGYMKAD